MFLRIYLFLVLNILTLSASQLSTYNEIDTESKPKNRINLLDSKISADFIAHHLTENNLNKITLLPTDLIILIATMLHIQDHLNMSIVCKTWNDYLNNNSDLRLIYFWIDIQEKYFVNEFEIYAYDIMHYHNLNCQICKSEQDFKNTFKKISHLNVFINRDINHIDPMYMYKKIVLLKLNCKINEFCNQLSAEHGVIQHNYNIRLKQQVASNYEEKLALKNSCSASRPNYHILSTFYTTCGLSIAGILVYKYIYH